VMRAGDKTCLLSRDEERVLSAIPQEYATDATKIRLTAPRDQSSADIGTFAYSPIYRSIRRVARNPSISDHDCGVEASSILLIGPSRTNPALASGI
jgi:hypothetical protein